MKEKDVKPSSFDVFRAGLKTISGFLGVSPSPTKCPNRIELGALIGEDSSSPVSPVNRILDEEGIPLKRSMYDKFIRQLQEEGRGRILPHPLDTRGFARSIGHEVDIADGFNQESKEIQEETKKLGSVFTREQVEMRKAEMAYNKAGAILHTMYAAFYKAPNCGSVVCAPFEGAETTGLDYEIEAARFDSGR